MYSSSASKKKRKKEKRISKARRASGHAPCQVQRTYSAGRIGLSCTDSPDGLTSGRQVIVLLQRQALIRNAWIIKIAKRLCNRAKENLVNRIQCRTMSVQLVRELLFTQDLQISRFTREKDISHHRNIWLPSPDCVKLRCENTSLSAQTKYSFAPPVTPYSCTEIEGTIIFAVN